VRATVHIAARSLDPGTVVVVLERVGWKQTEQTGSDLVLRSPELPRCFLSVSRVDASSIEVNFVGVATDKFDAKEIAAYASLVEALARSYGEAAKADREATSGQTLIARAG